MNKNWLVVVTVVALLLLLVGAVVIIDLFGPSPSIVLEVHGEPGSQVVGEASVDGVWRRLDATLPAKFTFEGKRLTFRLVSADEKSDPPIEGQLTINGQKLVGATARPGISGELYHPVLFPSLRSHSMISSFQAPDEDVLQFRARLGGVPRENGPP